MNWNPEIINITCTDVFYTSDRLAAYRLTQGTALVYIVPCLFGEPQRRVLLCSVKAGGMIPGFDYIDKQGRIEWRFALVAQNEDLKLEKIPYGSTNLLKQRFLENSGIDTFKIEGFENSLIEICQKEFLKDKVYVKRSGKGNKEIRQAQFKYMRSMFSDGDTTAEFSNDEFLRTAMYALKALRISVENKEKLAAKTKVTMEDIALYSNCSYREVVLEPDWYKNDCGVLLGTMNGRSVACIPGMFGKYTVFSGADGSKKRLDRELASMIEPQATVIERSLPDEQITLKAIAKHVVKGMRKSDLAWILVLEIVCTLIGILIPKLNQLIYDEYIPMGAYGSLIEMCAFMLCFMVGNIFFSLVKTLMSYIVQCRAGYDIQDAAYRKLFKMPQSFFRRFDSADLAERIMSSGVLVNDFVNKILSTGLASLISFMYIYQMLKYAKSLTFVSLLLVTAYTFVSMVFALLSVKKTKVIAEQDASAGSKLFQYITGIDKIRMSGVENRALLEYMKPFANARQESISKGRMDGLTNMLMGAGSTIFSMVLYYMIIKKNLNLSMGSFAAFNAAFGSVSGALMSLIGLWLEYVQMKPTLQRMAPVITEKSETTQGKDEISELQGAIELRNVTFSYDESKTVLNNISFSIKPGEYVGLVGQSGCGKSTILKLLLGFEKPKSGSVLYDGKDVDSMNLNSLRKHLGTVLQNGQLISGSIYENISISASKPSIKEVNKVIEMVGLKPDIDNMPMGIQTVVSENGGTISGGQKQRILIARAIYNNPTVLLFDEATSALDNITQAKVSSSLDSMHLTRVIIAHRLSTIKNCDRIIVIDKGSVAEEGNYDQLMARKGLFYEMASRQLAEGE